VFERTVRVLTPVPASCCNIATMLHEIHNQRLWWTLPFVVQARLASCPVPDCFRLLSRAGLRNSM
jgi:hypothetical protein